MDDFYAINKDFANISALYPFNGRKTCFKCFRMPTLWHAGESSSTSTNSTSASMLLRHQLRLKTKTDIQNEDNLNELVVRLHHPLQNSLQTQTKMTVNK